MLGLLVFSLRDYNLAFYEKTKNMGYLLCVSIVN